MKLLIPPSVFAGILTFNLNDEILQHLHSVPSAMISQEFENSDYDAALIPSIDLLKRPELFVSAKVAVSFDGELSNSYLYFKENLKEINEINLTGDVSANDALVVKLVFEEFYNNPVKISLAKDFDESSGKSYLVSGNKNFENLLYENGISLAEQLSEFLDYPYVNYVFVAKNEETIKDLNKLFNKIDETVDDTIPNILKNFSLPEEAKKFIIENLNSVYFEMTQNERDGLNELLRFAYYKGLVEDMSELKFVE